MSRRAHYSTALTQAQGIFPECLTLFELWEPGMDSPELFEKARLTNALNQDSERRVRNIVLEGFASRFLRTPYSDAASSLKTLFSQCKDSRLQKQIVLLYALRQHGIFFDFLVEEYWPAVRAGARTMGLGEARAVIDRGLVTGRLEKHWSDSVRKRVSSYVLGICSDFDLLGKPRAGERPILPWTLHDKLVLYLVYDLHFFGNSDDEVANAEEWKTFGLNREDVTIYLNRLNNNGHLIAQDTGHLCRIEWNYGTREEVVDVIIS